MNIAIVGAGAVGIATAHELACDGHQVTVYERCNATAEEASFANTGWLAPVLLQPWASPGLCHGERQQLPGRQALLRVGASLSGADLRWLWGWRQAGRKIRKRSGADPALLLLERLGQYSQQQRHVLWNQWQADPEAVSGSLVLLRSEAEREHLQPALAVLADAGVAVHALDAAQTRLHEPSLSESADISGALFFPQGEAANTRLAALIQRQAAQSAGVQFITGCTVQGLSAAQAGRPAQLLLQGESSAHAFDAIVVCAGAGAQALLQPLGCKLPLTGLQGYTLSAPVRELSYAPRHAIVDWREQLTIVRLGQRMRIGGGAELGTSAVAHQATMARMHQRLNDLFPGSTQLSHGLQVWRGSRSITPDGLPIVGDSGLPGIWLNLGHGSSGASLAQGCARALADLMGRRTPDIDISALSLARG